MFDDIEPSFTGFKQYGLNSSKSNYKQNKSRKYQEEPKETNKPKEIKSKSNKTNQIK